MEEQNIEPPPAQVKNTATKKERTYVYSIRDWKEYLGESLLIIFSVLLALGVTEYINKQHEKEKTIELVKSISEELKHNKTAVLEIQEYDRKVLASIDTLLANKNQQDKFVSNGEMHLNMIAPAGILYRYPAKEAWTIAKNNDIMSKLDIETVSLLTLVYEDLDRINKVEEDAAKVILDRASRDSNQTHTTLVLIKDIYHGWAVDRIPGLLTEIDIVIKKIKVE